MQGPLRGYLLDTFAATAAKREYLHPQFSIDELVRGERGFDRTAWGLLSLELWQQRYHDRTAHWHELRRRMNAPDSDLVAV
jgi:asparagine synthase (glutamine-hydrolysing)